MLTWFGRQSEKEQHRLLLILRVQEQDARIAELEARAKTAEAELARLRAAGTFNEGIEAAIEWHNEQRQETRRLIEEVGVVDWVLSKMLEDDKVHDASILALRSLCRPEGGA